MKNSVHWKYAGWIALAVFAFYWKIIFTKQFSILLHWENANQAYAWYHFAAAAIKSGVLPLWDAYTFAGHPFVGEMQTGLFYPLKVLLYLAPFDEAGLLSERIFNYTFVLAHFLAALFMYWFTTTIGISPRAALISGLTFSVAGFVGRVGWPNILDSAIWLPLILLFTYRAVEASTATSRVAASMAAGFFLGVSILGGSLHVTIMQSVAVLLFVAAKTLLSFPIAGGMRSLTNAACLLGLIAIVAFGTGAVQLLPSIEYSRHALRWVGDDTPIPVAGKIRYFNLTRDAYQSPESVMAFVFGAARTEPAEIGPYFGLLPFILMLLGAWRFWQTWLVWFFLILGSLAFIYAMGAFSLLHGLLYLVPFLDMAREPGRFIYLTHFAFAVLAGYGMDAVQSPAPGDRQALFRTLRALKWASIFMILVLAIPAIYGTPDVSEWSYFSGLVLLMTLACLYFTYSTERPATWLLASLLMFDVHAFNWTILNKMEAEAQSSDFLTQLRETKPIADFIRGQASGGRVRIEGAQPPNIGNLGMIETTGGNAVTVIREFATVRDSRVADDLLNVRFILSREDHPNVAPAFIHGDWKVYDRGADRPGWVVYGTKTLGSDAEISAHLNASGFSPAAGAILDVPGTLTTPLPQAAGDVAMVRRQLNAFELEAKTTAPGLLVMSEVYYPGWIAAVNGQHAEILRVDGGLRGVMVPGGSSRISMTYRPLSVYAGGLLSVAACLFTCGPNFVAYRKSRRA